MLKSLKEKPTISTTRRRTSLRNKRISLKVLKVNKRERRESQENIESKRSKENKENKESQESLGRRKSQERIDSQEKRVKEINQRLLQRPNNNKKLLTIYFLI